jgi:hypothetical protein
VQAILHLKAALRGAPDDLAIRQKLAALEPASTPAPPRR